MHGVLYEQSCSSEPLVGVYIESCTQSNFPLSEENVLKLLHFIRYHYPQLSNPLKKNSGRCILYAEYAVSSEGFSGPLFFFFHSLPCWLLVWCRQSLTTARASFSSPALIWLVESELLNLNLLLFFIWFVLLLMLGAWTKDHIPIKYTLHPELLFPFLKLNSNLFYCLSFLPNYIILSF